MRTLAGSEQLAGMKKVADGDVQNLMPTHYQIANNQKEKKLKMFQKKIKLSQLQILVVNWPVAQMASIATKWNQTNSMAFSPVQGFVHSELLNMYSNALT